MAIKTPEERAAILAQMAMEFNAEMPTDVFLKGDGSIWIQRHGNDVKPRKATQEEVIRVIFAAIDYSSRAISV